MAKVKNLLKSITPPIIVSTFRSITPRCKVDEIWVGSYASWPDAQVKCTGYDSYVILEKCKHALLKVKYGESDYERDSVLFDEIQYSWGLLAGLQKAALDNEGILCVLDFGGSLGSSYYQNKEFLNSMKELQWCIVEQPNFVECGKEYFESDQLKFFYTLEDCLAEYSPNVLLLSGVLQYLEKPDDWIAKFINTGIPNIILDRTSYVKTVKEILTVQNVPDSIYPASYPAWFFNEAKLIDKFKNYSLLGRFDSFCDPDIELNSEYIAKWGGFIFIRSE